MGHAIEEDQAAEAVAPTALQAFTFPTDENRTLNNRMLARVEAALHLDGALPETQLGVAMMACVLSMRRVLDRHKIGERGRRRLVIKAAVRTFESKLREHTAP